MCTLRTQYYHHVLHNVTKCRRAPCCGSTGRLVSTCLGGTSGREDAAVEGRCAAAGLRTGRWQGGTLGCPRSRWPGGSARREPATPGPVCEARVATSAAAPARNAARRPNRAEQAVRPSSAAWRSVGGGGDPGGPLACRGAAEGSLGVPRDSPGQAVGPRTLAALWPILLTPKTERV